MLWILWHQDSSYSTSRDVIIPTQILKSEPRAWRTRGVKTKNISRNEISRMKICSAINMGKVLIGRKKHNPDTYWDYLGTFIRSIGLERMSCDVKHWDFLNSFWISCFQSLAEQRHNREAVDLQLIVRHRNQYLTTALYLFRLSLSLSLYIYIYIFPQSIRLYA